MTHSLIYADGAFSEMPQEQDPLAQEWSDFATVLREAGFESEPDPQLGMEASRCSFEVHRREKDESPRYLVIVNLHFGSWDAIYCRHLGDVLQLLGLYCAPIVTASILTDAFDGLEDVIDSERERKRRRLEQLRQRYQQKQKPA